MKKCSTLKLPIIVGALGMIKKGTDKHINKILGSPSLYEIEKKNCVLQNGSFL